MPLCPRTMQRQGRGTAGTGTTSSRGRASTTARAATGESAAMVVSATTPLAALQRGQATTSRGARAGRAAGCLTGGRGTGAVGPGGAAALGQRIGSQAVLQGHLQAVAVQLEQQVQQAAVGSSMTGPASGTCGGEPLQRLLALALPLPLHLWDPMGRSSLQLASLPLMELAPLWWS